MSINFYKEFFSISAICNQCAIQAPTSESAKTTETSSSVTNIVETTIVSSNTTEEKVQQEGQQPRNNPPQITSLHVSEGTIFHGSTADVWVEAVDPDGDSLSYKWEIGGGNATIKDVNSPHTEWKAPDNYSGAKIIVTVADEHGASVQSAIDVSIAEYSRDGEAQQQEEQMETPTINIERGVDSSNSGYISGGSSIYTNTIIAGDLNGKQCKGYISFKMEKIINCLAPIINSNPGIDLNTVLTDVRLEFRPVLISGQPWNIAQYLNIKHHNFGTLDLSDFNDLGGTTIASIDISSPGSEVRSSGYIIVSNETLKSLLIQTINNCNEANPWFQIKIGLSKTMGSQNDFFNFHYNAKLLVQIEATENL